MTDGTHTTREETPARTLVLHMFNPVYGHIHPFERLTSQEEMIRSDSSKKNQSHAVKKQAVSVVTPPVKRAISVRALIQRLNRVLSLKGQKVMRSKPIVRDDGGKKYPEDVGRFFVLNEADAHITEHHLDLDLFGRRLAVLKAWEVVLVDH